jgi:hypothetical protein
MFQTLMNNSVLLVFLVTASVLAYSEYKKYLAKQRMSPQEFRSFLRLKLNEAGSQLLIKFVNALLIAFVISMVSFREIWVNDVFHIVFLTLLMAKPLHKMVKSILE